MEAANQNSHYQVLCISQLFWCSQFGHFAIQVMLYSGSSPLVRNMDDNGTPFHLSPFTFHAW